MSGDGVGEYQIDVGAGDHVTSFAISLRSTPTPPISTSTTWGACPSTAASASTAIALVLGTLAAIAVQRNEFFGKTSVSFLLVLPIALPGVITGIALQTSFKLFGFDFGLLTIIIGQATFCVVVAYNNVVARLRRLPIAPEEAAADLGADSFSTFRHITLPGMRTALLSGGLLAFALAFDEVGAAIGRLVDVASSDTGQAARVADMTAFFSVEVRDDGKGRNGILVEYDLTKKMFSNPGDERTEAYVTGRFG